MDTIYRMNSQESPEEEEEEEDTSRANDPTTRRRVMVKKKGENLELLTSKHLTQQKTQEVNNDDQEAKKQKSLLKDFIVDPDGKLAYYWMGIATFAVMYNLAVIILRVAFRDLRDNALYQRVFCILDNLADLIYLVDIVFQSRTAYLEDGCQVVNPAKLLRHYRRKTRFVVDVVAILPLTTVHCILSGFLQFFPFWPFSGSTNLTVPILRIARLLKYHTMAKFFETTDSRTSNPNLIRAFKLSLYLWIVIHWIGCIYYMVSEYEGLGTNDWVYPSGEEYNFLRRKYVLCTYWSTMTLTTIGERPAPVTDLEYVFTGMTFLIGVFVFAAVVGNVGDVISNMYAARQDYQSRMDHIKFYMQHRNVPEHLQDRVKKWADYSWSRTQAIDEHSVLQLLPDRLRTEVAIHVHLETLKKVKIFEECEEGLLRELVLKLRPQIYSPGDYICRIGEIGREMYILNHGKVEILVPSSSSGQRTRVAVLTPGNYFGEISLLKLDDGQNRRTADVRAIGYSELLCLSRRDLLTALVEYPDAKEILEAQARERMLQTKGVQQPVRHNSRTATDAPKRRARDVFAEVMKQEGFQKLLSTRGKEMTELKQVIDELKAVNKQVTQGRLDEMSHMCGDMRRKLQQKDRALKKALKRIVELETILRIRNRSLSLPVRPCDMVTHQDSESDDASLLETSEVRSVQLSQGKCNHNLLSKDVCENKDLTNDHNLNEIERVSDIEVSSDALPSSRGQDTCNTNLSDSSLMSTMKSSSQFIQDVPLPVINVGGTNKCSDRKTSCSAPVSSCEGPIDLLTLSELEAVLNMDPSLLGSLESGGLNSDLSSNSDASSLDEIEDI